MNQGRRLVIGDVHGCIRTLQAMVEEMMQVNRYDRLWILGDVIDRGPDSKAVIDYILKLRMMSYQVTVLMGNHEYMMTAAAENTAFFNLWMANSGFTTLSNFGITNYHHPQVISQVPEFYMNFLRRLPLVDETPGFVLVHAGLDPVARDPRENPDFLLWDRNESVNHDFLGDRILIHGHTPKSMDEISNRLHDPTEKCIPLDGGCVYKNHPRLGFLAGLELGSQQLFSLRNRE